MWTRLRTARPLRLALAACALLSPSLAAAQQYINLPGTQPGGLADGTPLDGANPCGVTCHFSRDHEVLSPMPHDTIVGSLMGNTMRDPLFLAALTIAEQDAPGVGDYCLRCHTPTGFIGGRTRGTPTASRGARLEPADRDGVTCDFCHRMTATTNLGNAQYEVSPTDTRFGPYANIDSIRHPGARSEWLADSRMCGTCHNITNPTQMQRDASGTASTRQFPLDTTYSEWVQSDFGRAGSTQFKTCQDCHMPRMGMPGLVSGNPTAMMRENPRRHDLVGGNAWMIRILARLRNDVMSGEYYDPDIVPFYEAAARRTEANLRTAVRLEIREAPMMATPGAEVAITARMTNLTGHRVPTGYAEGRRVWLDVTLIDADGRETVVSGAYNATEARLDTSDRQLRLYETHHGRTGASGYSYHIALNNTVLDDTRLPPQGYRPMPGHEPVGRDYSGGEGGALRHWDDARYTFTVPATARGRLTVRVRARYQATTREFVEWLVSENRTDDTGRRMQTLWNESGRAAPFDMAEATAQIMLPGGASGDGGVTDGGARDASADAQVVTPAAAGGGCSTTGAPASKAPGSIALLAGVAVLARRRRRR